MPGDNFRTGIELMLPVALEVGVRFAIRDSGRTVGAGVRRVSDRQLQPVSAPFEEGGSGCASVKSHVRRMARESMSWQIWKAMQRLAGCGAVRMYFRTEAG
eukprot:scaffold315931_cov19-Tisochrysis_lutea.AAC.1